MLLPNLVTRDAPDRRRRPRLNLAYALRLYRPGAARIEMRTQDISCEGFFCITDSVLFPREILECELVIQELRQPLEHDIILRGRAEVVRVVPHANGSAFGVACRLADYTIGPNLT